MDWSYSITPIDGVFVLALSLLLGFEVIKNIPAVLHTPLMSGSNAISGIILIGGVIQLLNTTVESPWTMAAASIAVLLDHHHGGRILRYAPHAFHVRRET